MLKQRNFLNAVVKNREFAAKRADSKTIIIENYPVTCYPLNVVCRHFMLVVLTV